MDAIATSERPKGNDLWAPFRYFLGSWTGTGTGKPNDSSVSRTYSLILEGQFLEIEGQSVFELQESNPFGEVHEGLGLVSYDRVRSRYVYRGVARGGVCERVRARASHPGRHRACLWHRSD